MSPEEISLLLQKNNDEMFDKLAALLAARSQAQPPPPPLTHTRDISRWRIAYGEGQIHNLVTAWLAGSLRHSMIGQAAQTHLTTALTTMAATIKDIASPVPSEANWLTIEATIRRALSLETSAEIFLKGELSPAFVQEAAEALFCEEPGWWSGTTISISRKADEITKPLQQVHRLSLPQQGRLTPRRHRAAAWGRQRGGEKPHPQPHQQQQQQQQQQQKK